MPNSDRPVQQDILKAMSTNLISASITRLPAPGHSHCLSYHLSWWLTCGMKFLLSWTTAWNQARAKSAWERDTEPVRLKYSGVQDSKVRIRFFFTPGGAYKGKLITHSSKSGISRSIDSPPTSDSCHWKPMLFNRKIGHLKTFVQTPGHKLY